MIKTNVRLMIQLNQAQIRTEQGFTDHMISGHVSVEAPGKQELV